MLRKIYCKNYFIMLSIAYIPVLWKVLSISYLYDIPDALKVLSQIALLNIIFKCFEETFFNPLFKIVGNNNLENKQNRNFISNRILLYLFLSLLLFGMLILLCLKPIMKISYISSDIFDDTYIFLILYLFASILKIISKYLYTIALIDNDTKNMFIYLLINTIVYLFFLTLFVPSFSLRLGVIGIACSEIIASIVSIVYLFVVKPKSKVKEKIYIDLKEYLKLIILAFIETTMRNLIYYFVILVMLNMINNQDLYFIANEFIWSVMLVPTLAQSSLIKQDISNNKNFTMRPYFINAIILNLFIVILIPLSILVFKYFYLLPNYMEYFYTLLKLLPCYVFFVFDSIIEAYFITLGNLKYILIEGILTNLCVYLVAYILYLCDCWVVTLNSIVILFNIGVIVSSIYTILVYVIKKYGCNKIKDSKLY